MSAYDIHAISSGLCQAGYIPERKICLAASTVINYHRPLLIEGASGTGKTSLAYAAAQMLGLPLIRISFFEGIEASQIAYDYDYQKMLLSTQLISSAVFGSEKKMSMEEAMEKVKSVNFFDKDFLIPRPLLQTIMDEQQYVLLLDEIDKTDEATEFMLLEFLESFALSIPQYGTIRCPQGSEPLVFITSNGYRNLSEAFCRRCSYLYIPEKTKEQMLAILEQKSNASSSIQQAVANILCTLRQYDAIKQKPSAAEGIVWADFLQELQQSQNGSLCREDLKSTLGMVIKNHQDEFLIQNGETLDALLDPLTETSSYARMAE